MQSKLLHQAAGQKTFALIFATGDEIMSTLEQFAKDQQLAGSHFTAIGALEEVTLGYFDWQKKEYLKNPVQEQVEVVSLMGDIATGPNGEPKVHAHIVIGKRDGTALTGHLLSGRVRPTLELILTQSPTHLQRRHDEESGLALIDLGR
jgi:predicted DNA-binding protein with PD1-like motif